MKLKRGSINVRRLIFIADSSSTTGAGLANLTSGSAGLVCWYFAADLSNDVQITLVSGTLGTYTSGGFVAVDNTNMPGWYEIGIPNAALDGGNEVAIQLRGATNMVPVNIYIELDSVDYQDAAAFGLSRLDAEVTSRMATYTQPTGFLAATFPTTVASPTNITSASGIQLAANQDVRNVTGAISDKAGYSLAQAFPANFASMSIDASGRVLLQPTQTGVTIPIVTTVTDKSGYSLATAPPTSPAIAAQVRTELATELSRIDVAIGSRLAAAGYTAPDNASIAAIKLTNEKLDTVLVLDGAVYQFTANALELAPSGGSGGGGGLDAAGVRAAVGLASANLDSQLGSINSQISGGQITSVAPVATSGAIIGPIVIGDDYLASSSRSFDWFVDPGVFSIGNATCFFGGALVSIPAKSTWLVEGSVSAVTVDGQPKWRLRFELTTNDTLDLKPELHNWSVELRGPTGPENITKIHGTVNVINSYTKS